MREGDVYRPFSINFWPSFLDVLTAALMVFVLSTYLQVALRWDDRTQLEADEEAARVRRLQTEFLAALESALGADLSAKNIEVERSLASVHVRFNENILFSTGDYRLSASGKAVLSRFGKFLSTSYSPGVKRIQVEGHTDDVPFPPYKEAQNIYPANNWQLSSARATEVTRYLSEQGFALAPELFSSNGYGSHRPLADNATEAGRTRNRRVEIDLFFVTAER
jgi:chemotaxis protein MotB